VGGTTTFVVSDAALPLPKLDVTADVVFGAVPADTPVTFTLNAQLVFGAKLAPDRLMVLVPAVAVIAPPPHEPVRPFGVDITNWPGKSSVNPIVLSVVVEFEFVITNVSVVLPPT
jgi:hypothetical protein